MGSVAATRLGLYAADLIAAIAARTNATPGLHVTICTPKFPDYARGYERAAAYEAAARRAAILSRPTSQDAAGSRVFAFPPGGLSGAGAAGWKRRSWSSTTSGR